MTVEDFLAEVKKEGSNPFESLEKETPSESPTEIEPKEPKTEEPIAGAHTQEKDVPFHKHPRWIERETELKTLRENDARREREFQELKAQRETPAKTDIPEWFKELYGENHVAWEKYQERELQRETEIEQRVLQRQQAAETQKQADQKHWAEWVDGQIKTLKEEGNTFDENKLVKTMLDYRPTDAENNFDFRAGLKIMQALDGGGHDAAKIEARKQIADTANKSGKGEPAKKDYMTTGELRHRSWGSL